MGSASNATVRLHTAGRAVPCRKRSHRLSVIATLIAVLFAATACGTVTSDPPAKWHNVIIRALNWKSGLHLGARVLVKLRAPDVAVYRVTPMTAVDLAAAKWPRATKATQVLEMKAGVLIQSAFTPQAVPAAYLIIFQGSGVAYPGAAPPWADPSAGPPTVVIVVNGKTSQAEVVQTWP